MFEHLEEEVFEAVKGNYKTIVVCKFNSKGFLVSHSVTTTLVFDEVMSTLREQLIDAVSSGNKDEIARVQDLINRKREGEQVKPTL